MERIKRNVGTGFSQWYFIQQTLKGKKATKKCFACYRMHFTCKIDK